MKFQPKKLLALLLAGLLVLPTVACAKGGDTTETKDPSMTETMDEDDTGYKPDIEKKDYDAEFVITGVGEVRNWMLAAEDSAGDPLEDSIYEPLLRSRTTWA